MTSDGGNSPRLTHRDLWTEFFSVMMGGYPLCDLASCITWPTNDCFGMEDIRAASASFLSTCPPHFEFNHTEEPVPGRLYTQRVRLEDVVDLVETTMAQLGLDASALTGMVVVLDDRDPQDIPGYDALHALTAACLQKWARSDESWEDVFFKLPTDLDNSLGGVAPIWVRQLILEYIYCVRHDGNLSLIHLDTDAALTAQFHEWVTSHTAREVS